MLKNTRQTGVLEAKAKARSKSKTVIIKPGRQQHEQNCGRHINTSQNNKETKVLKYRGKRLQLHTKQA